MTPRSAQQVFETVAQATQVHRRHSQPRLRMPAHPVTQVIANPRTCYTDLFSIQHYFQALIREALDPNQYPLTSTATAHINVRIVVITNKAMAASFQFEIKFIEQDIRQQRRERTALRRPSCRRGAIPPYITPALR
ncbi:hypothetical protein BKM16_13935 [Pseudomonas amygdali pv. morsprunorum]|nr:hypothetical protein AL056_11150 [Pseudomonas amygdali pv. morsprunorum]KWS83036.1 hypothetical protein AL051_22345 [Pseudomonas amygdali pv. dendropanacis]KWS61196.1 hypothetical protein AL054_07735 [Pseudomonas amygdali pv. morsprunorum]PHX35422.1 hypothetical protein AO282_02010 [Pseudomonas amygdali pv. morsprunorum]POC85311.1 hypothetical protein BKM08_18665 [Pseudomonas amygdali pv. morsprunorum]